MLSPQANDNHNGWQPRAKEQAQCQSTLWESRSPGGVQIVKNPPWRPNGPPLSRVFSGAMSVSD